MPLKLRTPLGPAPADFQMTDATSGRMVHVVLEQSAATKVRQLGLDECDIVHIASGKYDRGHPVDDRLVITADDIPG